MLLNPTFVFDAWVNSPHEHAASIEAILAAFNPKYAGIYMSMTLK